MKTTERQYAQALFDLTKGKNQEEIDAIVLKFSEELRRSRNLKMIQGVIEKFEEIYNKANGIVVVDIVSASKLEEDQISEIIDFAKKKYKAKEVILNKKVKKSIVGGVVLRVGDDVIDGSVKGRVDELKRKLLS